MNNFNPVAISYMIFFPCVGYLVTSTLYGAVVGLAIITGIQVALNILRGFLEALEPAPAPRLSLFKNKSKGSP